MKVYNDNKQLEDYGSSMKVYTSDNKQLEEYGSSMKVYNDFWQQTTWRLWQFGESVQWLLTTNSLKTMTVLQCLS